MSKPNALFNKRKLVLACCAAMTGLGHSVAFADAASAEDVEVISVVGHKLTEFEQQNDGGALGKRSIQETPFSVFVSGVAYTDSELFSEHWGNHGWAEVYFPDYGWVPFDISYRQLGFIDATHIELQKGVDGTSNSVHYSHRGEQDSYSVNTGSLDFDSQIIKVGKPKDKVLKVKAYPQKEIIGGNSYDVIFVEVTNTAPYYLVDFIQMAKTVNIKQTPPTNKFIYLAPYEKKVFPFLIQAPNDLNPNLIYTYPFSIFVENTQFNTEITILSKGEIYTQDYMEQYLIKEKDKIPIEISCSSKEQVMVNTSFEISCKAQKDASLPLKICLENDCKKFETLLDTIYFEHTPLKLGVQTIPLLQVKKGTSAKFFVSFKSIDNAKLSLQNISIDKTIEFDEQKSLTVTISKDSFAQGKNATLSIIHDNFIQQWEFPVVDENKQFELLIAGNNLGFSDNEITIKLVYFDSYGKLQTQSEIITIELVNLELSEKLIVGANSLNSKLIKLLGKIFNLDTQSSKAEMIAIMSAISLLIAAIVIIKILFKVSKIMVLMITSKPPKPPKKKQKIAGTKKEKDYMPK